MHYGKVVMQLSILELIMRESNKPIQLVVCTDNNFIAHTAALLQSVKQHASMPVEVHLFAQLNPTNLGNVTSLSSESFKICVEEDLPDYSDLPISKVFRSRLSQSAFWRIAIPDILKDKDKALYLDSDMIALGDIAPLWGLDISNVSAAVVLDSLLTKQRPWVELRMSNERYFNSGMMLLNLVKWRNLNLTEKTLRLVKENPEWPYNDQHALNVALNDDIIIIEKKWNVQTQCLLNDPTVVPKLVHFTGFEKPWHQTSVHPYTKHYRRARDSTLFSTSYYPLVMDSDDERIIAKLKVEFPEGGTIAIWGAGMRGRRLAAFLKENCPQFRITNLIDIAVKGEFMGIPIKASITDKSIKALIIATLPHRDEVLKTVRNLLSDHTKII